MTSSDMIHFEDWEKLDLRIGKIIEIKDHPNAEKLYILIVDFGEIGQRTIIAGLKPYCTKSHLLGKSAVFLVNLEPRTLRGIESHGMLLAASSPSKSHVCILTPDGDIESGSKIN